MDNTVTVIDADQRFSPLRRRILESVAEPASATGIAERLGETRQRVNYHLRQLERGGLVELVEERRRRGRVERIMRATSAAVVTAPSVVGRLDTAAADRYACDALLARSATTINEVTRLRQRAEAAGKRLLTFTVDAEIGFDQPSDIERFTQRLAELAAEFDSPTRRYRVVIGGYPAPTKESST